MRFLVIILVNTLLTSYPILKITRYFNIPTFLFKLAAIILLVGFQSIGLLDLQKKLLQLEQLSGISKLSVFVHQSSYLLLGTIQCLVVYLLFTDFIKFILHLSLPINSLIHSKFCKISLPLASFVTLITVIIGIAEIISGPKIEKVEIVLDKLPMNFDGFTIAQISDLHVGSTIKCNYVERIVNITNALKPNIIALTGDFVDGNVDHLKEDVAPLANLSATHGVFFISGNHEYYSGIDQWFKKFASLGITNLINEHVLIKQNDAQIVLGGVTDYSTIARQDNNASNPYQAVLGAPKDSVKILLAHQPASYLAAKKAGFDLQLSGHTHGGQFFPFTFFIRFFHRYYRGLNNHEGMWIYINRGTGYWGPPLRAGSSPEITLITLRRQ